MSDNFYKLSDKEKIDILKELIFNLKDRIEKIIVEKKGNFIVKDTIKFYKKKQVWNKKILYCRVITSGEWKKRIDGKSQKIVILIRNSRIGKLYDKKSY